MLDPKITTALNEAESKLSFIHHMAAHGSFSFRNLEALDRDAQGVLIGLYETVVQLQAAVRALAEQVDKQP